jgi:hypothetical protein
MRLLNRLRLGAALWLFASAAGAQTVSSAQNLIGYHAIYQGFPNAALTGSTSETNAAAIRIPANTMGATGAVRVIFNATITNSANVKSFFVRLGASGITSGGLAWTQVMTTVATAQFMVVIRNASATNSQVTFGGVATGGAGIANNATAIDTTADIFVNINQQLALGTETTTLIGYSVEVLHP